MALRDRFRTHRLARSTTERVSDGAQGWLGSLVSAGTVEGSLQPAGAAEQIEGAQEDAAHRWLLFLDPLDVISRDDVLQLAERLVEGTWLDVEDGPLYRVVSVGNWVAGGPIDHRAVQLEEIQRGQ